MKKIALIVLIATLAACTSTNDATNGGSTALVNFSKDGCGPSSTAALTAGLTSERSPLTTATTDIYDGFTCVSWDATTSTLKIELINFHAGCEDWKGDAKISTDGSLELYANHEPMPVGDESDIVACGGSCCGGFHDWSYEVSGIATSKDCPLKIVVGLPCEGDDAKRFDATLPLTSKAKGVVCRYVEYGYFSMDTAKNGSMNMACRNPANYPPDQPPVPCDEGLVCTVMDFQGYADASLCLKTCTSGADCPLDGLLKCDTGVCKLAETW